MSSKFEIEPLVQVWVGRLAMMGFLTSLLEEFWTGKGTLQQIGFSTPSGDLFTAISLLAGGATLIGTISTLSKATGGKLSPKCVLLQPSNASVSNTLTESPSVEGL